VAETKNSGKARLIPFVFSSEQAYVLELGELYLRVYAYGARVGTVEVATPWSAAQLGDLQFYQSADQMWIAHPAHALRVLTRTAHTTWTLAVYELGDGPYDEMDTQGTLLTPADYGALTPVMTSNSTPSGAVSSSPAAADAWEAFDKNKATWADFQGGATGWIVYQGTSAAVVDHYYFTAMNDAGEVNRTPISWVLEGSNDGATWVTLDTRSAETIWTAGETRFYEFTNQAAFLFHRFRWNGTDGDIWTDAGFAELGVNRTAASQTAFALTASSVAGINGGAGFQAGDVGRPVRLQGSDGVWRWAEIVSRVSATVVTVKLHGHALPDLSPISRWQLGAFKAGNQASAVTIYEERLALARRFSVFMSKTGDLDDFGIGEADDDGMKFTNAGGGQANDIVWLADGDGYLLVATTGGVRALSGSGIDEALTPSSFKNRRSRTHGAAKMQPVDAGSSLLYVTRSRKSIAELTMNQYGRFSSEDIGQISEHITRQGVASIAWQQNPDPVLWFTTDYHFLAGYTHQPSQEVRGMHRHEFGGAFAGEDFPVVENVCVTPGQDGENDDVWLIIRRTIGGVNRRYIELLTAPMEGPVIVDGVTGLGRGVNVMDTFAVDSGLTYEGAAVGTVTGLSHLNGQSVDVLADGTVYSGLTVAGGSVTLPGGATATKMHVGLPFSAEAHTLELDVGGRDGSLMGRRKKVAAVILSLYETDTTGLEISSLQRGAWESVKLPSVAPLASGEANLFTGNVKVPIDDSWEGMGQVRIRHTHPTPCTIRAMTPVFDAEP